MSKAKKPGVKRSVGARGRGIVGAGTADKFGRTPAQQAHSASPDNGWLGQGTKGNPRANISPTHGINVRRKGAVRD
jgi:hypothetical protein